MKFRIDDALWDGRRPDREQEWQQALLDMNAEQDGLPPIVTVARRPDGGVDLVLVLPGEAAVEQRVALTFDMMRDHFKEYRDVIGRLARADAGALGMRDWETLDYAKKLVHDEAGSRVRRALRAVVPIELTLARQLFTLIFLVAADIPAELVRRHRRHGPLG